MNDETPDTSDYIHGSSPEERKRLSLLNTILNETCLKEIGLGPGDSVLDLGSGLGQLTGLMAVAVGPKGKVVGIERDPDQFAKAIQLVGAGHLAFRQGDATAVPLEDDEWRTFDVVHARFLLEHVPNPQTVVDQMARAVRPGGRVIIVDDDHGDFRPWPEPEGFADMWHAYAGLLKWKASDASSLWYSACLAEAVAPV